MIWQELRDMAQVGLKGSRISRIALQEPDCNADKGGFPPIPSSSITYSPGPARAQREPPLRASIFESLFGTVLSFPLVKHRNFYG